MSEDIEYVDEFIEDIRAILAAGRPDAGAASDARRDHPDIHRTMLEGFHAGLTAQESADMIVKAYDMTRAGAAAGHP